MHKTRHDVNKSHSLYFSPRILNLKLSDDRKNASILPLFNDPESTESMVSSSVFNILGDAELNNAMNKIMVQSRVLTLKYLEHIGKKSTIEEILPRNPGERKDRIILHTNSQSCVEPETFCETFWSGLIDHLSGSIPPTLRCYANIAIHTCAAELHTYMACFYSLHYCISRGDKTRIEIPEYLFAVFQKYYIISEVLTQVIDTAYHSYVDMLLEYQQEEIFTSWLKSKCTPETEKTIYIDQIKKAPPKFGDVARDMYNEIRWRELNEFYPLNLDILFEKLQGMDSGRIRNPASDPVPLIVARWSKRAGRIEEMRDYLSLLAEEVLNTELGPLDMSDADLEELIKKVLLRFKEALKKDVENIRLVSQRTIGK